MNLKKAELNAVNAAKAVGQLMRRQLHARKRANEVTQHDIKLELDVRSQRLIETRLHHVFPQVSLLGEEGVVGDPYAQYRWVVDPIDGTVNFAYTIPHACVSIALQRRADRSGDLPVPSRHLAGMRTSPPRRASAYPDGFETVVGVVYDPFCDELWTGVLGGPARLNGKVVKVSRRRKLSEAIVSIGFAKSKESLEATLPYFNQLVYRVRKVRMMGAAALALTYVASGRFDGYIERGIRIWDIAAGGLILECAGGEFWRKPVDANHTYRMVATNGLVRRSLAVPWAR